MMYKHASWTRFDERLLHLPKTIVDDTQNSLNCGANLAAQRIESPSEMMPGVVHMRFATRSNSSFNGTCIGAGQDQRELSFKMSCESGT